MSESLFRQRPWGYDRAQVDAFVERTASRFSALQTAAVPDEAIRDTIDRITNETNGVLQRAYEIAGEVTARAERDAEALTAASQQEAQELTARARQEAQDLAARAQQEAQELTARTQQETAEQRRVAEEQAASIVRGAEARVGSLDAEIGGLERERDELLGRIEAISQRLHALVSEAGDERSAVDRPASDETVETARAVAATPGRLTRPPVTRPAGGDRGDRTEEQRTTEMPAAVVARDENGVRG